MSGRADLNALILFYEVANAGSISAASQKLNIPKSTISRKVTVLEHQVGAKLLQRSTRSSSMTEIGRVIYGHAQSVVTELENAGIQVAALQSKLSGVLRVSFPVDFGVAWLSSLVAAFGRAHPDIRLVLDINNRWVDVRDEPYDVVINLLPPRNMTLPVRKFSSISRGLYVAPSYLESVRVPRRKSDLAKFDIIVNNHQLEEGIWGNILSDDTVPGDNEDKGLGWEPRVVANNIGMVRELVVAGMGVGLLPNVMSSSDVNAERLVRLFEDWDCPPVHAYASYLGRTRVPRKTKTFLELLSANLIEDEVRF